MHHGAENARRRKKRHRHVSAVEHAGNRDANSSNQSADIAAQHAGDLRAFKRQVDGRILVVAENAYFSGRAEHDRKDKRKLQALGHRAFIPQQNFLDASETHHDACNRSGNGDLDE